MLKFIKYFIIGIFGITILSYFGPRRIFLSIIILLISLILVGKLFGAYVLGQLIGYIIGIGLLVFIFGTIFGIIK